jgi:hypothetical protein
MLRTIAEWLDLRLWQTEMDHWLATGYEDQEQQIREFDRWRDGS